MAEKGITEVAFKATPKEDADKIAMVDGAGKTSRDAYFACLFLLMADGKRFKVLKRT